jgi:hypothetical protein
LGFQLLLEYIPKLDRNIFDTLSGLAEDNIGAESEIDEITEESISESEYIPDESDVSSTDGVMTMMIMMMTTNLPMMAMMLLHLEY